MTFIFIIVIILIILIKYYWSFDLLYYCIKWRIRVSCRQGSGNQQMGSSISTTWLGQGKQSLLDRMPRFKSMLISACPKIQRSILVIPKEMRPWTPMSASQASIAHPKILPIKSWTQSLSHAAVNNINTMVNLCHIYRWCPSLLLRGSTSTTATGLTKRTLRLHAESLREVKTPKASSKPQGAAWVGFPTTPGSSSWWIPSTVHSLYCWASKTLITACGP